MKPLINYLKLNSFCDYEPSASKKMLKLFKANSRKKVRKNLLTYLKTFLEQTNIGI